MAADDLSYPLLFIDRIDSRVEIVSTSVDKFLKGLVWSSPKGPGDRILVDSDGRRFDLIYVASGETADQPADVRRIESGRILWTDVLKLVEREVKGDFGDGFLDFPDRAQRDEFLLEIWRCKNIKALAKTFNGGEEEGENGTSSVGRGNRKEFIKMTLMSLAFPAVWGGLFVFFLAPGRHFDLAVVLGVGALLLFELWTLINTTRRLADMNVETGVTLAVLLAPLGGGLVASSVEQSLSAGVLTAAACFAVLAIWLAATPGSPGKNRYGPPPKA